jgi:hypothetical protein
MGAIVRRLQTTPLDSARVATLWAGFENELVSAAADVDWSELRERWRGALRDDPDLDLAKTFQPELPRMTRFQRLLCERMQRLEDRYPLSTGVLLHASRAFDRPFLQACARGYAQLWGARHLRCEPLSDALLRVSREVIDAMYFTLIEVIYRAECLDRGVVMKLPRGGLQARQVVDWCGPALIDRDAVLLRNAAAHHTRWEYSPADDLIVITDRRPDGPSLTIRPRRLYRRYLQMYRDAFAVLLVFITVAGAGSLRIDQVCGLSRAIITGDESAADPAKYHELVGPTITELERLDPEALARVDERS